MNENNNVFMISISISFTVIEAVWQNFTISEPNMFTRIAISPLTAGVAYIRVFIFYNHIKYHILNMLKIKCDINLQDFKTVDLHCFQKWIIFIHLKLWIASARHNFKWVKIQIDNLAVTGLRQVTLISTQPVMIFKGHSVWKYVSIIQLKSPSTGLKHPCSVTPSSLGQSHASAYRRSLAVSSTIISYICLCGHLGCVSEIQTSLDVLDL